jgi:hypothetical protein
MSNMSSYEQLYERYWSSNLKKSGTRYERLTAFVFKALHDSHTVIHDIKLLGESDVKHQIDVKRKRCQALKCESDLITPCLFAGHIWDHTKN